MKKIRLSKVLLRLGLGLSVIGSIFTASPVLASGGENAGQEITKESFYLNLPSTALFNASGLVTCVIKDGDNTIAEISEYDTWSGKDTYEMVQYEPDHELTFYLYGLESVNPVSVMYGWMDQLQDISSSANMSVASATVNDQGISCYSFTLNPSDAEGSKILTLCYNTHMYSRIHAKLNGKRSVIYNYSYMSVGSGSGREEVTEFQIKQDNEVNTYHQVIVAPGDNENIRIKFDGRSSQKDVIGIRINGVGYTFEELKYRYGVLSELSGGFYTLYFENDFFDERCITKGPDGETLYESLRIDPYYRPLNSSDNRVESLTISLAEGGSKDTYVQVTLTASGQKVSQQRFSAEDFERQNGAVTLSYGTADHASVELHNPPKDLVDDPENPLIYWWDTESGSGNADALAQNADGAFKNVYAAEGGPSSVKIFFCGAQKDYEILGTNTEMQSNTFQLLTFDSNIIVESTTASRYVDSKSWRGKTKALYMRGSTAATFAIKNLQSTSSIFRLFAETEGQTYNLNQLINEATSQNYIRLGSVSNGQRTITFAKNAFCAAFCKDTGLIKLNFTVTYPNTETAEIGKIRFLSNGGNIHRVFVNGVSDTKEIDELVYSITNLDKLNYIGDLISESGRYEDTFNTEGNTYAPFLGWLPVYPANVDHRMVYIPVHPEDGNIGQLLYNQTIGELWNKYSVDGELLFQCIWDQSNLEEQMRDIKIVFENSNMSNGRWNTLKLKYTTTMWNSDTHSTYTESWFGESGTVIEKEVTAPSINMKSIFPDLDTITFDHDTGFLYWEVYAGSRDSDTLEKLEWDYSDPEYTKPLRLSTKAMLNFDEERYEFSGDVIHFKAVWAEDVACVKSSQVWLSSELALILEMDLPKSLDHLEISYNGTTERVRLSELVRDNNGFYRYIRWLPAACMDKKLTLTAVNAAGNILPFTNEKAGEDGSFSYSIRDYLTEAIYRETAPDLLKLLHTLDEYGLYAQRYFKEDDTGIRVTSLENKNPELYDLKEHDQSFTGTLPQGISYVGFSLTLESTITIKHYFQVDQSVQSAVKAAEVSSLKADPSGLYVKEIQDIPSYSWSESASSIIYDPVSRKEVWRTGCSVYSYIHKALTLDTTNQNLKDLMVAMYEYGEAARTYGECEHTVLSYIYDRQGYHYGVCTECGASLVRERCLDGDGDGNCDRCDTPVSSIHFEGIQIAAVDSDGQPVDGKIHEGDLITISNSWKVEHTAYDFLRPEILLQMPGQEEWLDIFHDDREGIDVVGREEGDDPSGFDDHASVTIRASEALNGAGIRFRLLAGNGSYISTEEHTILGESEVVTLAVYDVNRIAFSRDLDRYTNVMVEEADVPLHVQVMGPGVIRYQWQYRDVDAAADPDWETHEFYRRYNFFWCDSNPDVPRPEEDPTEWADEGWTDLFGADNDHYTINYIEEAMLGRQYRCRITAEDPVTHEVTYTYSRATRLMRHSFGKVEEMTKVAYLDEDSEYAEIYFTVNNYYYDPIVSSIVLADDTVLTTDLDVQVQKVDQMGQTCTYYITVPAALVEDGSGIKVYLTQRFEECGEGEEICSEAHKFVVLVTY